MGFLNNLFGSRESKSVRALESTRGGIGRAVGASRGYLSSGVPIGTPGGMDIERAVPDAYEKVIYVFKCVDTIAQNQADVPILLRADRDRDNGRIIEDKRISDLLNVRANPYETAWQFRYRLSSQLLLSRRGAFVEVINGRDGRPSQLHLLPAGRTEPIPDPDTFVSGYQIRRNSGELEVVPPERVIWVKSKPHPIDPYLQMTPLVAAGLASDTDVLARQFNYNFLKNDGRPGMLVTLDGMGSQDDVEEIRRRFSGGPQGAGRTTVIEAAGLAVQDMSGTPRDAQWLESIDGAKKDIFLAFGVPESIMGDASDRTFSNADAEYENFWVHTEVPHCNSIATALDPLLVGFPEDSICAYNYDTVDVLQMAKARKREEWRDEFQMGLRTADSYFELTGQPVWNVPGTQSLRMGGAIVAPNEDIQDYLDNRFAAEYPPVQISAPGFAPQPVEASSTGTSQNALESTNTSKLSQRARALAQRLTEPPAESGEEAEDIVDAEIVGERKGKGVPHDLDDEWYELVGHINGALDYWHRQQEKVFTDRLNHVKFRKGTRFWTDDNGQPLSEDKALHVVAGDYIVNTEEWVRSIVDTLRPRLIRAAKRRARATALDMGRKGVLDYIPTIGTRGTPIQRMFPTEAELNASIERHIQNAERIISEAAMNQGSRLIKNIEKLYSDGGTLKDIDKMIRQHIGARSNWRKTMSERLAQTVMEGVKHEVWSHGGSLVNKTWITRRDEKVRVDHTSADNQTVSMTSAFLVGGELLMHPGDPHGSPGNIIGCRCVLEYSHQESPAGETMDNINPTGSIFVEYAPEARAATELADNLDTYASALELSDDEMVTVYRGVPGGTQTEITPGDFITTNRQLAEDYAGTGDVVSQQVRAGDILTDIDEVDGEEYIYRPRRR